MLPLTLALGAALAAPAQAQSLIELVESARAYDSSWQSAQAQLEAARRRADQARAGLLPSAGLSAGVSRSNTASVPVTATAAPTVPRSLLPMARL
ncbi:MAG TPA: TolC family protein, partial [Giesbergeria sp.]|nr:TolC family protein [Giesbergeria sp.]